VSWILYNEQNEQPTSVGESKRHAKGDYHRHLSIWKSVIDDDADVTY